MPKQKLEWVVVETEYPTSYGCNSGLHKYTIPEVVWNESEVSVHGGFKTKKEATIKAIELRDASDYFDGRDECDDDDKLPFDSAKLQNWDNDTEFLIEVMKRAGYEADQAEKQQCINSKREEQQSSNNALAKAEEDAVKKRGRVHYSFPSQPYDIKAEMEIDLNIKDTESPAYFDMNSFDETKAMNVKTLMIKEESNGYSQANVKDSILPKILSKFTSLQEFHWHWSNSDEVHIKAILEAAPFLCNTLKVINIPLTQNISPSSLKELSKLHALEHISLISSFNTMMFFDFNSSYAMDSDNDEGEVYPYDGPLFDFVKANAKTLKSVDISQLDDEGYKYFFRYMCSHDVIYLLRHSFPHIEVIIDA